MTMYVSSKNTMRIKSHRAYRKSRFQCSCSCSCSCLTLSSSSSIVGQERRSSVKFSFLLFLSYICVNTLQRINEDYFYPSHLLISISVCSSSFLRPSSLLFSIHSCFVVTVLSLVLLSRPALSCSCHCNVLSDPTVDLCR